MDITSAMAESVFCQPQVFRASARAEAAMAMPTIGISETGSARTASREVHADGTACSSIWLRVSGGIWLSWSMGRGSVKVLPQLRQRSVVLRRRKQGMKKGENQSITSFEAAGYESPQWGH